MAGLNGLGGDGSPNFDALGILYIVIAVFWTILIFCSLLWLYSIRDTIAVRIRNFWLLASAVVMLNLYEIAVLIRYPMNGSFKCGVEFWIMSTLLPFGIALFQASNIQLLSYYEEQQHLARFSFRPKGRKYSKFTVRGLIWRWKQLTTVEKTYASIFVGVNVQLIVTLIIFFGSRAFHKNYGFFGPGGNVKRCRHTPEWIPSMIWQFLWAYVFGPYVLIRIRSIRDTHYWALQTRLAIIACLPGTPMWLTFRYTDTETVRAVNKYIVPALWLLPGLVTMQIVSIVIPILDARKQARYRQYTASVCSDSSTKSRQLYSMSALELQINHCIEPLLEWTSKKEFTAENIVFLKTVRDFKKKWQLLAQRGRLSAAQARECFMEAGLIFFNLVNPATALFCINIDSATYNDLESVFSGLLEYAKLENKDLKWNDNVVAPWGDSPRGSMANVRLVDDIDRTYKSQVTCIELLEPNTAIPAGFNINVFDKAFDSIKYLVFTNSWVRFVDAQETASVSESMFSEPSNV